MTAQKNPYPADLEIVRRTWARIVADSELAASIFYARLFEANPELADLFGRTDMTVQGKKLVRAISAVVEMLDRLPELAPELGELGQRHAGFGVASHHYGQVGSALLGTLEAGLGLQWNDHTREAWTRVYEVVSGMMRDGVCAVTEQQDLRVVA